MPLRRSAFWYSAAVPAAVSDLVSLAIHEHAVYLFRHSGILCCTEFLWLECTCHLPARD